MRDWKPDLLRAALLAAALVFLDALFGMHVWVPVLAWAHAPAPTLEGVLLVGLLPLARRSRRPVLFTVLLAVVASVPAALSVGEAVSQYFFRESFHPLVDLRFLSALAEVATGSRSLRSAVASVVIVTGALALVALPIYGIVATVRRAATPRAAAAVVLFSVVTGAVLLMAGGPALGAVTRPATGLAFRAFSPTEPGRALPSPEPPPAAARPGQVLPGDIHLLVVESYGATVFSNPVLKSRLEPDYAEVTAELAKAGIGARTSFFDSPVYGGRSWIADSTMATGLRVADQAAYDALPGRNPRSLSRVLAAAGYRTVFAAPATLSVDDTWEGLFPYDRRILFADFGYAGPRMGFGSMPDQYTLEFLLKEEVQKPAHPPLFIDAVLVSSHIPWGRVPSYVEDWGSLGDGSRWRDAGMFTSYQTNMVGGGQSPNAYADSIGYVLRAATGYAERALGAHGFVLIIGDHQPIHPVSEMGATRSVVAHVFSRDTAVLKRFEELGWTQGLTATEPAHVTPMEDLYSQILEVLGIPAR